MVNEALFETDFLYREMVKLKLYLYVIFKREKNFFNLIIVNVKKLYIL